MDNVASDGEYQKEGNQNLDIKKKKSKAEQKSPGSTVQCSNI